MLRFDPFADLDRMTRRAAEQSRQARSVMAFDAVREDDCVFMYFDVPGVSSDDLNVTVEGNELTVSAERRWDDSGQQVVVQERPQGTFTRRVNLSDSLDGEKVEADLNSGVLTVKIPLSEHTKPRSIKVRQGSSGQQEIETTTSGD
ncbi:MAG: Hsp20/alpha crystallin family protein [Acidimicrobiales bacterium]|nr:Hsp20/alpha crystallin family protein [Acidimicrobiales bacterium]